MTTLNAKPMADLYIGAYGLTLHLAIPSDHHLFLIKKILSDLTQGKKSQLDLKDDGGFIITGVDSVSLVLSHDMENKKTVFIKRRPMNHHYVEWKATLSQWRLCSDLLNGFISEKPAHQYLSKEGIDDALVEVSYMGG